MEQKDTSQISAFDTLFSNNHIQMLKVLLPYMDNQFQKYLAIYIKFQELQVALNFVRKHPYPLCGCMIRPDDTDPAQVVKRLLPLCTKEEKEQLNQILKVLHTMELMKDFMPEGDSSSPSSMTDMLMGMLTPEQKQMFDLFSAMGDS